MKPWEPGKEKWAREVEEKINKSADEKAANWKWYEKTDPKKYLFTKEMV